VKYIVFCDSVISRTIIYLVPLASPMSRCPIKKCQLEVMSDFFAPCNFVAREDQ
jgi:hypothetical protein